MERSCLPGVVAVALLAAAGNAAAQAAAPAPSKDKEAVTFREVERGLYLGAYAGPLFILNPPATSGPRPFSPGQMATVEVGLDIGNLFSIGLFLTGTASREGAAYIGSSGGTASGDFGMLIPGGAVRFNAVGLNDSQGTTRTFIYLRGGAGYAFYYPAALLGGVQDVLAFGGAGIEYYTRLRHFSIGLEATGSILVPSGALGFAVTPSLRYAF